ncbi:MAG: 4'-phosphopantetheinyl transferase family protein [Acidimicrobiales bacterium]
MADASLTVALPPGDAVQVDLWRVDLDAVSDETARRRGATLSQEESRRASRLRSGQGARRWIGARGALREILAHYLDVGPAMLTFAESEAGKPILATDPELRFNLAHSGGVALVGAARGHSVGVDVERLRDGLHELDVARRILGDLAAATLAVLDPAARTAAFFQLWVRHEAAVKCRGVGLVAAVGTDVAAGLRVGDVAIGSGYAAAWSLDAGASTAVTTSLRDWIT